MNEVIKIQGNPTFTTINNNSIILNFGLSVVKIWRGGNEVYSWYNHDNNLKTSFKQNGNATLSEVIVVGSHVDDVLRLLGKPNSVQKKWPNLIYGYSKSYIYISIQDNTVTKWNNNGD